MAAVSKASAAALLVAAVAVLLAASASAQTTHDNCAKNKKITVQNLCAHDVALTLEPLANSPHLFNGAPTYTLRPHSHAEFPVCWWTGRLKAPGAPTAEFHVGIDGGSFYLAANTRQPGLGVPVIVSPHGSPLQGECPAVGCPVQGPCSASQVPSGRCRNVQEIKVIYCSPHV
ncbi:hypothetical protein PAHAL_3G467700 [Panicum hallii]|jgi:hypothetical protein|uniref:Osmotin-like protein n=1 Tax=Panicum hallii TaxID=206008 RepID=A0A2S3HEQ3_9POAL|nr:uncharacterized protein LOC112888111 [Panicum hallii]PAN21454.1 hypothetical protein PAHAL_3G467700 [Panicum hallii]